MSGITEVSGLDSVRIREVSGLERCPDYREVSGLERCPD